MGNQVYEMLNEPNDGLTDYQKMEVDHLKHKIRDKQIKMEKGVTMQKNKILIEEREDGVLIGISRDGVDPYVKKVNLTWQQTLESVPFLKGMTEIAEQQWIVSPKNPSYAAPPKPEAKKVEPPKKTEKPKKGGKKPEQPALVEATASPASTAPVEQRATQTPDEKNPTVSPVKAETMEPSENVVVKTEEPKILAPTASVVEASPKEPITPVPSVGTCTETSCPVPVTMSTSVTTQEGTPEIKELPKTRTSADEFQYKLKDGRGPFADVQAAMDALGLDKATRPNHNRYDRLSKKLQEEIIREKNN